MRNNKTDMNEQPDAFSQQFRSRLENFEMPVDANCWEEIAMRIDSPKSKRIIPLRWWLSGAAAVAALVIVLIINTSNKPELVANKTKYKETTRKPELLANKTVTLPKETAIYKTEKTDNKPNQKQVISTTNKTETPDNEPKQEPIIAVDTIKKNVASENIMTAVQISTESKDSVHQKIQKRYLPNSLIEEPENTVAASHKTERHKWLIASSFGSGGAASLGGSTQPLSFANGDKYLSDVNTTYTSILAPSDFSEQNFQPALSFGLLAQRSLNQTFSLETGLLYTYLLSTFNQSTSLNTHASLTLHYVGIPVNVIAKIWKGKKWEFYLSGGGMIEKGLRSVYTQIQNQGNSTITTTANSKIAGLQWSINSGLGVTYKFQPKIGLYVEPKFSYFFDNNQPISTRTNQPIAAGLSMGIRYEFK